MGIDAGDDVELVGEDERVGRDASNLICCAKYTVFAATP